MLAVTVCAPTRRLTRSDLVGADLGVTFTSDQKKVVDRLIDAITSAIEGHCGVSSFAREYVSETLKGYGDLEAELDRRPVVAVNSVSIDSSVVTDVSIANADDGLLYRRDGWAWTAQHGFSLSGRQKWPAFGQPMAGREEPSIAVEYWGGYILPEQWLLDVADVSVVASDKSFNAPGTFPALLKPGDVVATSGFSSPFNNGRYIVAATPAPTTSKFAVTMALADEVAAAGRSILFDPPAQCRSFHGLLRGATVAVKAAWMTNQDDPDVIERQVGQLRTRRSEGFHEDPTLALPGEAIGYIRPWTRSA